MPLQLTVIPAGELATNAYLIADTERGEAVLVDAPDGVWADVEPLLGKAKCRLTELWLTHGHWDHMQDAAKIKRATGCHTRGHLADRLFYETPQIMEAFLGGDVKLEPISIDTWVNEGDIFEALGLSVEVRHVPGHCPGNILFYLPQVGAAIVGDALFAGSVGRTDFPGCSAEQLRKSILERIYTLPPETTVLPGHGPATTVGEEMASNPFVRAG